MRVVKFAFVGLTGVIVNEGMLYLLTEYAGLFYAVSGIIAIELSILSNFLLNDNWTFRDRKSGLFLKRLLKYNSAVAGGVLINAGILFVLTQFLSVYYLISNLFGMGAAFLWDYLSSKSWAWSSGKPSRKRSLGKGMVSVVIPTYNERESIEKLIPRIFSELRTSGIKGEVIIVDDNSKDGTGKSVGKLSKKYAVRLVSRPGKMGLSSAVIDGFRKAKGVVWLVMDADLSHPPEALTSLIKPIMENEACMTIGSRYVHGGGVAGWPLKRRVVSRGASLLAKGLTSVKDPMSGFFAVRKDAVNLEKLSPKGFKIGLEIVVKGNCSEIMEVPFTFRDRVHGESKLTRGEYINYLRHLLKLYWYMLNR